MLALRRPSPRKLTSVLAPLAMALALSGCSIGSHQAIGTHGGAATVPMTQQDFERAAAEWGHRYERDSEDKTNALNYAAALRRIGRTDQAVAVLQRAAINFPDDHDVMAAYGKALASAGQLEQALRIVERAQTPDQPDWRLLSAQAVILDQMGRNEEARRLYEQALTFAPNEPTILSNLGMSYVLTGDLPRAEQILRQAVEVPGADSRVRQNLALVIGLQGRFEEAEAIARRELSEEQATANIAYLRRMLSEQNNWERLGSQPG